MDAIKIIIKLEIVACFGIVQKWMMYVFKIMKYKNVAWSLRSYLWELIKKNRQAFSVNILFIIKVCTDSMSCEILLFINRNSLLLLYSYITWYAVSIHFFFFFLRMNKVYQVLSLTGGMHPNLLMSSAEQEKKEELFNNLSFTCCKIALG